VPAAFVQLDALPLTPNGKLDRKALPAPGTHSYVVRDFEAPIGEIEETLAAIWKDVLKVERVGRRDNFFELGGHSLLAINAVTRVRQAFNVDMALRDLFTQPVLKDLAYLVETTSAAILEARDLEAEAMLDPAITTDQVFRKQTKPKHVLLTGASGFLGIFLLSTLLKHTQAKVHCLIRCDSPEQGLLRIRDSLSSQGLLDDYDPARIVSVPGDLSKPLLGMDPDRFAQLAKTLDVIYHNGAWVNFLHTYDTLKASNVLGTQEVLRLAISGKLKEVHYVSTISVVQPDTSSVDSPITTEEQLFDLGHTVPSGYVQSKWVAEKMLRAAVARGIPVTVYRPGNISGSTTNGASNSSDTWSMFIDACLEHGCVPDVNLSISMLPVDFVSECIVTMSLRKKFSGRSLNLIPERSTELRAFSECILAMNIVPMTMVPYQEWIARCAQSPTTVKVTTVLPAEVPEEVPEEEAGLDAHQEFKLKSAVELLAKNGFSYPNMSRELLQKYVLWRYRERTSRSSRVSSRMVPDFVPGEPALED
jgi:thioester reductase-like protein